MERAQTVVSSYAYGIKQENLLADQLQDKLLFSGVDTVTGSGNQFYVKEDLVGDKVLVQVKSTKAAVHTLKPLDFKKLEVNAMKADKIPVFIVNFSKYKKIIIFISDVWIESTVEYLHPNTPQQLSGFAKVWYNTGHRTSHTINGQLYRGYFFEDFR